MFKFEVVKDEHRKFPNEQIQLPKRGTKNACAYDFYSPDEFVIHPGETHMLWTDVKARIPTKYMLMLNVRSSMGKHLIGLANTQGWIDCDYADNPSNDGNIGIMFHNYGDEDFHVSKGDRIAQGMIVRYFVMDDDYGITTGEKRKGGFGSTNS